MSNEKQNNWRERVEDADALPGEPVFDTSAAWDKLQQRLGYEPRRKKAVWYWAAAAVLLLMGWPLLLKRTTTALPVNGIVQKKQVSEPVSLAAPAKKEPVERVIISNPVVEQTVREKPTVRKRYPVTNSMPATTLAPVDLIETGSTAIAATTIDTAAGSSIAAIAEKKQLPVVHINDLEKPAPQLAVSPPAGRSRFRIKLSNHQPNQQLAASQKSNDGLINVKLSFKN